MLISCTLGLIDLFTRPYLIYYQCIRRCTEKCHNTQWTSSGRVFALERADYVFKFSPCAKTFNPLFPDLALGLPSHYILDTAPTGRECSGFPTGFFRVRAVGSSLYWSLHCADSRRDGNNIMLWNLVTEEDSQVHLICLISLHLSSPTLTPKLDEGLLHRHKRGIMPMWRTC